MSINVSDPTELHGKPVTGQGGQKLGKVYQVYVDTRTDRIEWAAVSTGMFGSHVSLVPLAVAEINDGSLAVPYGSDQLRNAPHHDPDQSLSTDQEKELFDHYGISYGGESVTADPGRQQGQRADGSGPSGDGHARGPGQDVSGPTTDDAMTRSEEELQVGTERVESGKARLRKYVTTEQQTISVPVSHEEVRVEREPITDENRDAATSGPEISEEDHEVTLHAEQPVVDKQTVPKERVRMTTETEHDQQQVSDQVRKEHIEADDSTDDQRRRGPGREQER